MEYSLIARSQHGGVQPHSDNHVRPVVFPVHHAGHRNAGTANRYADSLRGAGGQRQRHIRAVHEKVLHERGDGAGTDSACEAVADDTCGEQQYHICGSGGNGGEPCAEVFERVSVDAGRRG